MRSQLLQRNKQIAEEEEEEEDYDYDDYEQQQQQTKKQNETIDIDLMDETHLSRDHQLSRGDSALLEPSGDGVEEFSVSSSDDEALWEQTLCSRGMAGPKELSPRSVQTVSSRDIRGHKSQMVPKHLPWCPKST